MPPARISLTLSRPFTLSFIASARSSGLHPVSSRSCCMYVRAGWPAFARPYEGVHRSTSLMSSSLLLQQCPACLVRLTLIVFVMGGRWPYSWCFVGCCLQEQLESANRNRSFPPFLIINMSTNSLNHYVFLAINKFLTINNLFKYIYIYIYIYIYDLLMNSSQVTF